MSNNNYVFTSESVSEGHPDKVADLIADTVLDRYLEADRLAKVACEVLCKGNTVVVAGEITSEASVDHEQAVRDVMEGVGYNDPLEPFNASSIQVIELLSKQAHEIAQGVDRAGLEQGAGDQGIMFGFASDETRELMPLPIMLAHRLSQILAADRKSGGIVGLKPDAKTQVSVLYDGFKPIAVTDVVVSTQHSSKLEISELTSYVIEELSPRALVEWQNSGIRFQVNPTGSFINGGPSVDCGVTGRKIIVDTYGGMGRHGGGAFSGKDPSKVDRSGAYFCRYVAREIVLAGLATRVELQVAYAIGVADPVSIKVDTFGTGDAVAATAFVKQYDFRPAAIIERLDLRRPIYAATTNYGHFGRPGFSWEWAEACPDGTTIVHRNQYE